MVSADCTVSSISLPDSPCLKPHHMICSSLIIGSIQCCQIREANDEGEQMKPHKRIQQLQSFIITYTQSAAASQTFFLGSDVLLLGRGSHQAESHQRCGFTTIPLNQQSNMTQTRSLDQIPKSGQLYAAQLLLKRIYAHLR